MTEYLFVFRSGSEETDPPLDPNDVDNITMFYGNDSDDAPPLPPPLPEGIPLPGPIEESSIPLPPGVPLHSIPLPCPEKSFSDEDDPENIPLPKEIAPIPSQLPPPLPKMDGAPITEVVIPTDAPVHIESTQPVMVPPPVTEKLSPKTLVNLPKPAVVSGSKLSPSRNSTVSFSFNKKSSNPKLQGASVFRIKNAEKAAERRRKAAAQKAKQAEEAEKLPNGKFEVIGGTENQGDQSSENPDEQDGEGDHSPSDQDKTTVPLTSAAGKSPRKGEGVPEDADGHSADGGSKSLPGKDGEQNPGSGGRGDGAGDPNSGGGAGGTGNGAGDGDKDKEKQEGGQPPADKAPAVLDTAITKVIRMFAFDKRQ